MPNKKKKYNKMYTDTLIYNNNTLYYSLQNLGPFSYHNCLSRDSIPIDYIVIACFFSKIVLFKIFYF